MFSINDEEVISYSDDDENDELFISLSSVLINEMTRNNENITEDSKFSEKRLVKLRQEREFRRNKFTKEDTHYENANQIDNNLSNIGRDEINIEYPEYIQYSVEKRISARMVQGAYDLPENDNELTNTKHNDQNIDKNSTNINENSILCDYPDNEYSWKGPANNHNISVYINKTQVYEIEELNDLHECNIGNKKLKNLKNAKIFMVFERM